MKTIKDMPEHSRPREKLREKGASALTDEDLVAAILGRGVKGLDVVAMSRNVAKLIRDHTKNLSVDHLTSVPGMWDSLRRFKSSQPLNSQGDTYSKTP